MKRYSNEDHPDFERCMKAARGLKPNDVAMAVRSLQKGADFMGCAKGHTIFSLLSGEYHAPAIPAEKLIEAFEAKKKAKGL